MSGKITGIERRVITVQSGSVRILIPYREGFKVEQEVNIGGNQIYPAKKPISVNVFYDSEASSPLIGLLFVV